MIVAKKKQLDKLSLDMIRCEKDGFGVHYGRWKALQDPVLPVKDDKIPEGWRICEWCGKPYKPWSKRPQKYCQVFCQESASRERIKERNNGKQTKSVPSEATGEAAAML